MAEAKKYARGNNPNSAQSRFKPGEPSPYPSGRPKGSGNRQKIISEVLNELVTANFGGQRKKIPAKKASLLVLLKLAMEGKRDAIGQVMRLWKENDDYMNAALEAQYPFNDADRQVIDDIYARMKASKE